MNKLIKKMGVLFTAFLLLGCDPKSKTTTQTPTNNTNDNGSRAEPIQPDPGISPEEFFCKIAKIDKSTRYKRALIRYSITQTNTGATQKTLRNRNPLQEGTFQSSCVIEVAQDERGELTYFATKETNNYLTQDEDFITDGRKTPLTIWDWESYHADERAIDRLLYEVYSESFHIDPYSTSMSTSYLGGSNGFGDLDQFETNERTFNNNGLLETIYSSKRTIYYGNSKNKIGSYEIVCNGTVEYFEQDTDLSPEAFEENINKINYGTYTKANIEYTVRECLIGSMPGVNYQNGDPLPDGSLLTLKMNAEQTSDLKVTCNYPNPSELTYSVKELITGANVVNIKSWLCKEDLRKIPFGLKAKACMKSYMLIRIKLG